MAQALKHRQNKEKKITKFDSIIICTVSNEKNPPIKTVSEDLELSEENIKSFLPGKHYLSSLNSLENHFFSSFLAKMLLCDVSCVISKCICHEALSWHMFLFILVHSSSVHFHTRWLIQYQILAQLLYMRIFVIIAIDKTKLARWTQGMKIGQIVTNCVLQIIHAIYTENMQVKINY